VAPDVTKIKRNDIQWLRAIAATEVTVWHSDLVTKFFSSTHIHDSFYKPLGGVGVELFFILSGYVICMQAPTYRTGAAFMMSRLYRLTPLYWLFTTLVLVAYFVNPAWRLHGLDFDGLHLLKSYLFFPQQGPPVLGVGWTLEHEMVFYAIVAVAMVAVPTLHRQEKFGIAFLLAGLGLLGFVLGTGPSKLVWDFHLASPYMLAFGFGWFMRVLDEGTNGHGKSGPVIAFCLIALAAFVATNSVDAIVLYRIAVAGAVFTAFCRWRAAFEASNPLNRVMGRIGDASFSLYLSHWFILSMSGKVLSHFALPASMDLGIRLSAIALCTALGYWLFVALEKPVDRYLRGGSRNLRVVDPLARVQTAPQPQAQ
jgi:exopolysaccharide production protein ExoZ